MPDRFYISPWGVHPDRARAGTDAQTLMERWWTQVGRILQHRGAFAGDSNPAAGGGAAAVGPRTTGGAERHGTDARRTAMRLRRGATGKEGSGARKHDG